MFIQCAGFSPLLSELYGRISLKQWVCRTKRASIRMNPEATCAAMARLSQVFVPCFVAGLFLAACGSSPSAGQPAPPAGGAGDGAFDCESVVVASSGIGYEPSRALPNCYQQFLARVDDARSRGDFPNGSRGRTIIIDDFVDFTRYPDTTRDLANLFPSNEWVAITYEDFPFFIPESAHGLNVHRAWQLASIEGLRPLSLVEITPQFTFTNGVRTPSGNGLFRFSESLEAWRLGVESNPLFDDPSQLANTTAIINLSFGDGFHYFLELDDLAKTRTATARNRGFDFLFVTGAGNGSFPASGTFRVLPSLSTAALSQSTVETLSQSEGHLRLVPQDRDDDISNIHLAIPLVVDDFIASLTTETLGQLARSGEVTVSEPRSWRTVIDEATVEASVAESLDALQGIETLDRIPEANRTGRSSVLSLLAEFALMARGDRLLIVSHLRADGRRRFGNVCAVARDACIYLPYLADGTSFATPRASAVIDQLWLLWPSLTRRDVLDLLFGCTEDLGRPGIDGVFGQGLLDFSGTGGACVFTPTGTLRDPTTGNVASGALALSGTSSSAYLPVDEFARDFPYSVVSRNTSLAGWAEATVSGKLMGSNHIALYAGGGHGFAAAWVEFHLGSIIAQLELRHEPDGLLGALGSGSFQLSNGLSLASRLSWATQISDSLQFVAEVAHAVGSADGAQGSIIRDIDLATSHVRLAMEWQWPGLGWGIHAYATCHTGQSGDVALPSTSLTVRGQSSCSTNASLSRRF